MTRPPGRVGEHRRDRDTEVGVRRDQDHIRHGRDREGDEDAGGLEQRLVLLAWTEQAIAELERPPPLIRARRMRRRVVRLARKLSS
jgi:hypothetical protein